MNRLGITVLAVALGGFCQCAHQEVALEDHSLTLTPEYQPPPLIIATALDDDAELARRAELERDEKNEKVASFIFDAIAGAVSGAIFGDKEERREKRWKESRKRKILVKKGYIDKDDGPQPEGFPSQF